MPAMIMMQGKLMVENTDQMLVATAMDHALQRCITPGLSLVKQGAVTSDLNTYLRPAYLTPPSNACSDHSSSCELLRVNDI